ncbi:hypothetical protein [Pseudarthrobacter sp. S9]|uniref:hypothetical protein n=1 Tax=Pseudarthrobacter sp. S9 TaxID=3418421 RepID=UPI003D021FD0
MSRSVRDPESWHQSRVQDQPSTCTCYRTPESTWTRYGSAVEPGSQIEPNPDCKVHFND